jgi:hypothetical protein
MDIYFKSARSPAPPPGANPTSASYNASAEIFYNAMSSPVRFEDKNIFFYFFSFFVKNALAYYTAGVVVVHKFKSRRIGSWSQSYNRELRSQRCNFLQRHG